MVIGGESLASFISACLVHLNSATCNSIPDQIHYPSILTLVFSLLSSPLLNNGDSERLQIASSRLIRVLIDSTLLRLPRLR